MSLCPQAFEETEAFERHGELPQDLTDSLEWMERHSEQEPTNSLIFHLCLLLSFVSFDWKTWLFPHLWVLLFGFEIDLCNFVVVLLYLGFSFHPQKHEGDRKGARGDDLRDRVRRPQVEGKWQRLRMARWGG